MVRLDFFPLNLSLYLLIGLLKKVRRPHKITKNYDTQTETRKQFSNILRKYLIQSSKDKEKDL